MFKDRFIYSAKIIAVFTVCLTFCFLFAMPTYATNDTASEDDPVKLTADFIKEAEITVENDTVILCKTTNISGNDYRAETVCLIPKEGKTANELLNEISDYELRANSQYNEQFDGSYSVKGWIRVYYQTGSFSHGTGMRITEVDGGYIRYDNSVHVTTQSLFYGCTGKNAITGQPITQYEYKTPTSSSWSYDTSSWQYVVNDATCNIGAYCRYTLARGTGNNTWYFELYCTLA